MAVGILAGVIVIVGLGLYIIMPKTPKPPGNLHSISELETYLEQVVAAERPPGLSVAVVKDGQVVYENGFGFVNRDQNLMATAETIYHWWSMTKVPTAVAIMQLHERGLLDIDDPIKDYLPNFVVTHDGAEQPDVSIRQVLNHSAGLSNAAPEIFTWIHLEGEPAINQTELVVSKFSDYDELLFQPGEKTQYSNWGYIVLGALIEAITGQTYEEYIVGNILQPLSMINTNFVYTELMAQNEAIGSQHIVDMYTIFFPLLKLNFLINERVGMRFWLHRIYNDQTSPSGLIGPVTDIASFMIAYLNGGRGMLQPKTILLMNEVLDEPLDPENSIRGLGWEAHLTLDGRRYLTHSGGGPGFATIFRVYPDENLGLVVMGNDSTIDRETLADVLANIDW